jgi:hypothetical protein
MSTLAERLRERAESYRMGGPSSEHTAAMLDDAAAEIERLQEVTSVSLLDRLSEAEAEVERLKSDVTDLVRAGSDEATENARLREAVMRMSALAGLRAADSAEVFKRVARGAFRHIAQTGLSVLTPSQEA